ncbi:hypothetical protein AB6A40_005437 [Gnathostoma spinigerum]|uniref:Uncharacterized protein n=1 Tax=Gnathostoma spinigerum TaxID=75299 RepID=A0ABD6EFG3_9BILA
MPKIIHALTSETESQSKNNVEPIIRDVTVKKTAPFHKTSSKVNKSIGKTGTDEERSATSTRMITEIGRIRTQKKNGLPRLIKDRTNSAKPSKFRHKEESFAPESASVRSPNITADVLIRNKPEVFLMEDHVELNAKQLSSPRKTNSFSEKPRLTVPIIRSPAKTTGTNNAINNVRQSARSKQCQTLKSSHSPRARSSTPSNSNSTRTGTSARSVQVFETSINNPLTHHSELLEFCAEEKAQMRCRLKVHSSDCSLLPTNVRKQRVTFRNAPHSSSPRLRNPQLVRNSGVSNNMKVKNRMPIPLRSLSTSPRCVSPPSLPSAQGNTRLTRPPCTRFPSTDASITPRSHPRPPVITNHGSITEKTKINAKHSGSCSTASRPSLIKTGSQSRPVWR